MALFLSLCVALIFSLAHAASPPPLLDGKNHLSLLDYVQCFWWLTKEMFSIYM
jgi:hypothetical protein